MKLKSNSKSNNKTNNFSKQNLRKLNNLSSVIAIIAGLNNAAVGRLKFTRDSISKENQQVRKRKYTNTNKIKEKMKRQKHVFFFYEQKLEGLISECSSENGYSNYRKMLAAIQGPCIPYL